MYVIVCGVKDVSEGEVLSIVFLAVDPQNLRSFRVVHILRVVVVLIDEPLHLVVLEVTPRSNGLLQLERVFNR